jgi:chromate transporter
LTDSDPIGLFLVFLKASALSLGGLSSLPLLESDLVAPGIATEDQVVQAIAIGRISTGPNGLYVVSLGYLVGGIVGAAAALIAATVPPLIIVPITAVARRWLLVPPVAGLVRGVALVTAGLLAATGLGITASTGTPAIWQLVLAVVGTVLSYRGTIHPALVIAIGAVAGLALGR